MFKMEIRMDENRIVSEGKYSMEEIQELLLQTMNIVSLEEREPGMFYGKGDKEDFSRFGGALILLHDKNWFLPFVEKWLWYTDLGIEDVAEHYRGASKA